MASFKLPAIIVAVFITHIRGAATSQSASFNSPESRTAEKCMYTIDLSLCRPKNGESPRKHTPSCDKYEVCQKEFKISVLDLEPYSSEVVRDLVRGCCGNCTSVTQTHIYSSLAEIPRAQNSSSHFVFPVLGRSNNHRLYGYNFIPLVEVPSVYYVTGKHDDVIHHVIMSCLSMWPMIIICLLMVAISGFIAWLLETRINNEQFPSPFLSGWFEGFWWSFISMTTVGYGDKFPKSISARLFSVVWIFMGITTFSLVTAMLSSEIVETNSPPTPSMAGSKVGVLRNHLYDAILVEKHGGLLVDVDAGNVTEGIKEMVDKLMSHEIDGMLLDRYTLLLFNKVFAHSMHHYVHVLKTQTVRTEIFYSGIPFAYGILVKNSDDYEFLSDFILNNRDVINTCNGLLINSYSFESKHEGQGEHDHNPLFSPSGGAFWTTMSVISIIILFICCFGFVYELKRRNLICSKACVEDKLQWCDVQSDFI